jgi:transaldolase
MGKLHDLYEQHGQSPWLDNLKRGWITGGELQQWIDRGVRGVTSNPTIFAKAISGSADYDTQFGSLVDGGATVEQSYWELVKTDIENALALLRPVYDSCGGNDGFVSVEVAPELARDTAGSVDSARELWRAIDEPNLFVKIPGTAEGIPAIQQCLAEGININVTLLFGIDRYGEIIDAFMTGLEELDRAGGDVTKISSVASFFVSRVDTETDRRLPEGHPLRGKAAVANAKLAYQMFLTELSGARWKKLEAAGARKQRPLWASTSTKNPAYSPTLYVDELIGADTVNTLAQASVDVLAKGDADLRADSIGEDVEGARQVLADLAGAGVDFADVTATLEREGVESFAKSFHDALATLDKKAAEVKQ